jgi:hypothetical protein
MADLGKLMKDTRMRAIDSARAAILGLEVGHADLLP